MPPRPPLLDPHQEVAGRLAEPGADERDVDAREDAELVEVALGLEQPVLADRLAALDPQGTADDVAPGAPVAAHDDAVEHHLRPLEHLDRHVDQRVVLVPGLAARDLGLVVAERGVARPDRVERVSSSTGWKGPSSASGRRLAQAVGVERLDALEARGSTTRWRGPSTMGMSSGRAPRRAPRSAAARPRAGEAVEGVVGADVVEILVELRLDEPAAAAQAERDSRPGPAVTMSSASCSSENVSLPVKSISRSV